MSRDRLYIAERIAIWQPLWRKVWLLERVKRAWTGGWPGSVTETDFHVRHRLEAAAADERVFAARLKFDVRRAFPASTVALPLAPLVATLASWPRLRTP